MTEDDLERRLREAFAAAARQSVNDARPAPAPRFASEPTRRRRARLLAPLAAAAAVVAVVGGILAVARDTGSGSSGPVAGGRTSADPSPAASAPVSSAAPFSASAPASDGATTAANSVHIRLYNADGEVYGVGMPVVAIFNKPVADARPFVRAADVTVNGKPTDAAWYFEDSPSRIGAMEAHLRPAEYWPAHAEVHVSLATQGVSAGRGMVYDDSLTLDFTTGARTIATVDDRSNVMTVRSDGREVAKVPVSLGMAKTPTMSGTKVIMQQHKTAQMKGPGFDEVVQYAQQLSDTGEYLYAAPQALADIKGHVDATNGCTAILPADAAKLYKVLRVGDLVEYPNANGAEMSPSDGFGDWNVPWAKWVTGGLLPTR